MSYKKLPISFIYALLISLGIGMIIGFRDYLGYAYHGQAERFDWNRNFYIHIVNYSTWTLLLPLAYYFITTYKLNRQSPWKDKVMAVLASLLLSLIHEIISNVLYFGPIVLFGPEEYSIAKLLEHVFGILHLALLSRQIEYWILYTIITALEYARKYKNNQIELAQMSSQLSRAQLNALRLQLQPHFLFNTLNTISSLMEFDIKRAQKIVSKLGNLLRTVLDKNKRNLIPLREELEFIRSYLDIEHARFLDRLTIEYDVDDNVLDVMVPGLILQPIVENALKHGFTSRVEGGTIKLEAARIDDHVQLCVVDDGKGSDLNLQDLLDKGIGLKNVKERLDLLYEDAYKMTTTSVAQGGFKVCIQLPYRSSNPNSKATSSYSNDGLKFEENEKY